VWSVLFVYLHKIIKNIFNINPKKDGEFMKKYAAKFLCIVVFLSTWGSFKTLQAQSDYSVPLTFSVSATGINRYISSQWGSIQTSWSGT